MKKDLLSIADLPEADVYQLLEEARRRKTDRRFTRELEGRTMGMIFQKPSTRTSVSFAVAIAELGGVSLSMNAQDLQMKRGESVSDTARVLSRYVSVIMIRANKHSDVEELARYATVPVINGLTDKEHPCQVLSDLLTAFESLRLAKLKDLKGLRVAYVGDGNNVAQSWMLAAGLLGFQLVISCPEGYDPEKEYVRKASSLCEKSGGQVVFERNPHAAVADASVIYTDVWASMGKEDESAHRKQVFMPYQVNEALLRRARGNAVVMHCLPAHRDEEIAGSVLDGPQSVVFDQAENRLHVQKAVLLNCLK
ncbi:MAG: ornithine carbamoyltransferase [Elusimicrobia bacterium]|nr:ornithine carbamoyltransferase [Elusimicrobiota bacterium]